MRSRNRARWAALALATTLCVPALGNHTFASPRDAAPPGAAGSSGHTSASPRDAARPGEAGPGGRPRAKSLADCTSFDQADKDDATVEFTIHNTCTIPIDCSISWRVVCAPGSHKRRAEHDDSVKLSLVEGAANSADASAKPCGDDAWAIDHVVWSCAPNKE